MIADVMTNSWSLGEMVKGSEKMQKRKTICCPPYQIKSHTILITLFSFVSSLDEKVDGIGQK
jgi:hypothetical protein